MVRGLEIFGRQTASVQGFSPCVSCAQSWDGQGRRYMSWSPSANSGYVRMVEETPTAPSPTQPEFDVPPMRVAVMLVGTLGDTMPFVQFCKVMQERYGHVFRICTHNDLRKHVEKAGLRFYPLAGNAQQMAGWGPSFSLKPLKLLKIAADPRTPYKLMVLRKVFLSSFKACTEPDPEDQLKEPFHADCIIANGAAFAHVHCAEALGVPLHLFFPNPWVATRDYPHPFSGWEYKLTPRQVGEPPSWTPTSANRASYRIVDEVRPTHAALSVAA